MFLSDDCIMIPACMVSYAGEALDEKTPLHRAEQALSREGSRLFKQLEQAQVQMRARDAKVAELTRRVSTLLKDRKP